MTTLSRHSSTAEEEKYYSQTGLAFKALAPFYDIASSPLLLVRKKIVDMTGAPPGSRVLDVATGTGGQALAFASKGYETVGVDLSEAMLKVASAKNRYTHARFEAADATHLRFDDNSFDVSTISFALHDMPAVVQDKVLKEMVRVTRPEGVIMIVDYALPKNAIGRFLIYRLISLYEYEYYHSFIAADLEALLRKAGIRIQQELPLLLGAARVVKGIKMS